MVILDVKDRTKPALLATFDYVPPFHGGNLGAAHTSLPVVVKQGEHPDLVVHTDEIFDCPPGFGRILDVSDLKAPDVVKASARPTSSCSPRSGSISSPTGSNRQAHVRVSGRSRRARARRRICRCSTAARRASCTSTGTTKACTRWTFPTRLRPCSSPLPLAVFPPPATA